MRHVAASCGNSTRGCFLARSTAELAASDPEVALRAERVYGTYEEILLTCLTRAQHAGDIDTHHNPRALAALLLITVRGMDGLSQAGRGPEFMRQVADHSVAFLAAGHGDKESATTPSDYCSPVQPPSAATS